VTVTARASVAGTGSVAVGFGGAKGHSCCKSI